jgi:3-hydroxybutyryl-CoA dehydrogenase
MDEVGVIGFGTMGAGIAQACAAHGYAVTVLEADASRLALGRQALERFTAGGVERGKLSEEERAAILDRITGTVDVTDLAAATIVIEAVSEDAALKRTVLRSVEEVVGSDALIATNTSALSVTSLAASLDRPERFLGLHFFNPAALMPLVEVVRALQTDEAVIAKGYAFATSIGKSPITTDDRPGFVVNRLLMPYLNQAITELDSDLGTAADIDVAVRLGLGHPMGPFELLDLIGLDTHHHATLSAYEATADGHLHPPSLLERMVAAGWLGNKSGRGLRQFDAERRGPDGSTRGADA